MTLRFGPAAVLTLMFLLLGLLGIGTGIALRRMRFRRLAWETIELLDE